MGAFGHLHSHGLNVGRAAEQAEAVLETLRIQQVLRSRGMLAVKVVLRQVAAAAVLLVQAQMLLEQMVEMVAQERQAA